MGTPAKAPTNPPAVGTLQSALTVVDGDGGELRVHRVDPRERSLRGVGGRDLARGDPAGDTDGVENAEAVVGEGVNVFHSVHRSHTPNEE
ncbi:hypothetical protein JOC45_002754 [Gordonia hydrophobica]|nr:hypothetical protein [Gordonia hydrophobica]